MNYTEFHQEWRNDSSQCKIWCFLEMLKAGLHSLDTSQVGDAVNTICILEMECLAQEPLCSCGRWWRQSFKKRCHCNFLYVFHGSKKCWALFCRGSSRSSTSSNRWKQSRSCQSGIGSSAKSRGLWANCLRWQEMAIPALNGTEDQSNTKTRRSSRTNCSPVQTL